MKKILLACMMSLGIGASAQVGPPQASTPNTLNGYGFAQSSGTYTSLSASRTIWQSGSTLSTDAVSPAVTLPSVFKYNGKNYTSIYISNNGFITFGSAPLAATYSGLSTDNTTNLVEGVIAGFGVNLKNANTTTSEISYETVGSKFIVQFTDLQGNSASAAQLIAFQIQLDSSNNSVAIVYGTCASGTGTLTGQVGLKGAESSDVNNRTGTNWTTTAIGTSNSSSCTWGTGGGTAIPASGLTFTFAPGTWVTTPATYATLPFTESFGSWANGNSTADLPNASNWRTWPSRGDNSWRASDISTSGFTSAAGWTSTGGGATVASPAVTPTARFHSFNVIGVSGYMDLYVDLSTGGSGGRVITFDYINVDGTDKLDVLLSTDGGVTFSNLGSSLTTAASWINKSFSTTSTASNAIIRFLATGDNGNTDIQLDNLNISVVTCLAPTNLVSTGLTTNSATVSWTAPAAIPASGYDIYYSTTNTAPTSTTTPNITGITGVSTTIPGLTPDTTYYIWVRSHCSAADQSGWVGTLTVYTGFCQPSSTAQTSWIAGFTSTGGSTNMAYTNSGTSGAAGGYSNLTASNKISNYAGSNTPISLTAGGPTCGFAVWIDWNNNLTFETTEKMYVTSGYVTTTSGASITVPNGTALGSYRMRVLTDYNNSTPTNPCSVISRGEYIDYTFEVVAAPSCTAPTALTSSAITTTSATVSWTAPSTVPANGYDIYYSTTNMAPTSTTTLNMTGVTGVSTALPGLIPSTTYYVWVRSNCSAVDQSTWAGPISFTTLTPPPANDDCSNAIAVTLGSTFAQNSIIATNLGATTTTDATATHTCQTTGYKDVWYSVVVPASGNVTIETQSVSGSSVTDTVLGVYSGSCGSLTQVGCDDDSSADGNFSLVSVTGQTPGSTLLIGVWNYSSTTTGQFKLSAYDASMLATSEVSGTKNNIKVYPNPFNDVLNISDISKVKSISVTDIAGRLVKTIDNPASALQLGDLNSGMYLVTLNMKDGSKQTIKAIKK